MKDYDRDMPISVEQQDKIIADIANGMSLSDVCRQDSMPHRATVHALIERDDVFRDKYARAATVRAEAMFEEILNIADDGTNDWMDRMSADGSIGETVLNGEHVQRSRLRIDARKWILSKMNPKKYGEKLDVAGSLSVNIASKDADW